MVGGQRAVLGHIILVAGRAVQARILLRALRRAYGGVAQLLDKHKIGLKQKAHSEIARNACKHRRKRSYCLLYSADAHNA